MSTPHTVMQRVVKLGLILMMGVSMSACSGDQHWKEEVLLSDGRVIVVERELITEGGGDEWAINRSGVKPKEYRVRFEYPASSGVMIEWRSTKIDSQTWPEIPLIFDVVSEKPVVFSLVSIDAACEVYLKYIYRDGAWIEEKLPDKFEKLSTNLFLRLGVGMPDFVDLETKRKVNSSVDYRRSLKQVGPTLRVCG